MNKKEWLKRHKEIQFKYWWVIMWMFAFFPLGIIYWIHVRKLERQHNELR
jgi:hypothetical protein